MSIGFEHKYYSNLNNILLIFIFNKIIDNYQQIKILVEFFEFFEFGKFKRINHSESVKPLRRSL